MVKDYYASSQTIDGWIDTIETEFNYVKVNGYSEIVKMLSIDSDNEIEKIKQALLIVFGKKLGVLTFEDACNKLKIKPTYIDDEFLMSINKLRIIIKAINDGWYPNWDDSSENKYVVYFKLNSGFSYYYTDYNNTDTNVPSALCLKTNELAYFMANYFIDIYKIYFE